MDVQRCVKVVSPLSHGAGLGHRLGGIVFAYHIANSVGASLKIPPQYFNKTGKHGSFPRATKLLSEELLLGNRSHYLQRSMFLKSYSEKYLRIPCGTLLWVATNSKSFCHRSQNESDFCFKQWPGAFSGARPFIRESHLHSPYADIQLHHITFTKVNAEDLTVAWHIRRGDQELGNLQYVTNIMYLIKRSASGLGFTLKNFLFTSNCTSALPTFGEERHKVICAQGDEVDHVLHMSRADILVSSGSSFAHVPAMMASMKQVFISGPPKEAKFYPFETNIPWQTYRISGSIEVNSYGHASSTTVQKLRTQVLKLQEHRKN